MLGAIWAFLKALPEILALLKEVWAVIQSAEDYFQRKAAVSKLKDAIQDARVNKDTTKLNELFGGGTSEKSTPPQP